MQNRAWIPVPQGCVRPSLGFQKTQSRFAGEEKPGTWPQLHCQPTLSLLSPLGLGCPICRMSSCPLYPLRS